MGQRLNIEIHDHKSGGLQANAYYHWSGYSESAIELTREVLKTLGELQDTDPQLKAIKALEATGAGLTDEEKVAAAEALGDYVPKDCTGRNGGLIAVTRKGMDDTRNWEEGRVEIHLNTYRGNYLKYDVFFRQTPQSYKEDYERDPKELPLVDFDFEYVPFDKLDELERVVKDHDDIRTEVIVGFIK